MKRRKGEREGESVCEMEAIRMKEASEAGIKKGN